MPTDEEIIQSFFRIGQQLASIEARLSEQDAAIDKALGAVAALTLGLDALRLSLETLENARYIVPQKHKGEMKYVRVQRWIGSDEPPFEELTEE